MFTIVLILVGVGTALYALGALLEGFVEGDVRTHLERRRMDRTISRMSGHVIVCGWGRVGTSSQQYLRGTGLQIVAVDRDPERLRGVVDPHVLGDVTDDAVLAAAGIDRAHALIAALDTDADNVFVTLSARALRPDLIIVSRARNERSMSKLLRAGADRVVNPQLMGGRRMAAFALQPHVADFLDVVMHDEELDYRLEQMEIGPESPARGQTLRQTALHERTGVLLLALRRPGGQFLADPDPRPRSSRVRNRSRWAPPSSSPKPAGSPRRWACRADGTALDPTDAAPVTAPFAPADQCDAAASPAGSPTCAGCSTGPSTITGQVACSTSRRLASSNHPPGAVRWSGGSRTTIRA